MYYHDITKDDMKNGEGLRVVLWISGCDHKCEGCQNPVTWNPNDGVLFDEAAKEEIYMQLGKSYISGITFSGGDPLYHANREEITAFAKEITERFPEKTIWLYTGYYYEEVKHLEIMKYIDVLVDGPYEQEKRDDKLHWCGSTNQHVLYLKQNK